MLEEYKVKKHLVNRVKSFMSVCVGGGKNMYECMRVGREEDEYFEMKGSLR